ncbi:MAG: hypothetical protein GXP13_03820 [Gammaproteobacteria bacterium]|nr:hypothetical protein [Gammaproteobacteria bacterium]
MLRKLFQQILTLFNDKPLGPPSEEDKKLVDEFRVSFAEIALPKLTSNLQSEINWFNNMSRLRELVLTGDPRDFLRWDVIKKTMFVAHSSFIPTELSYLKKRPDWSSRWQHVINESSPGHPLPYAYYPKSSGNLIHQAYHLAVFEEQSGQNFNDVDLVVEFGGGYGSMCRLFNNLGYAGKYIIFDLKPFSLLQTFYLKSLGIPILTLDNFKSSKTGVLLLSEIFHLKEVLNDFDDKKKAMFLATWSISETPLSVRETFLPLIAGFGSYLIAYQDSFGEVDNIDYFNSWKKENPDVSWRYCRIKQLPGSSYLMSGHR